MHDLQLVGFTTDRRGLIFRTRAGARPEASFVVPITDELVELVGQLAEEQGHPVASTDEPDTATTAVDAAAPAPADVARPRSQMSVRDIQARLRAGEATARIAAEAGVEVDWIERFAPPVRAEQGQIVARALDSHLQRPRSAPSAVPLRRAVGMALADKGIAYTVAAYEAAWSARLLGHDRWAVTFTYHHRGRERTATWSYDAAADVLTTSDRAASQLGYVPPGQVDDADVEVLDGIVGDPAAHATAPLPPAEPTPEPASRSKSVPSTARRSVRGASAPAGVRVTTKRASSAASGRVGTRSTAGKAGAERPSSATTPAPEQAGGKKAVSKKAAAKQAVSKKATAKKAVGTKAVAKGKAASKKAVAKRKAAPKKAAGKRSPATKQVAAKQTPATKQPAAKPPVETAPARTARAKTTPAKEAPRAKEASAAEAVPATPIEASRAPGPDPRPTPTEATPPPTEARPAPAARRSPVGDVVEAPTVHRRLPDGPPRPAATRAWTDEAAAPSSNGHTGAGQRTPEPRPLPPTAGRGEADPIAARRARAVQRTASTVHFRSGSAAPVRAAGDDEASGRPDEARPAGDGAEGRVGTNGAARPTTRRRRQLRAR